MADQRNAAETSDAPERIFDRRADLQERIRTWEGIPWEGGPRYWQGTIRCHCESEWRGDATAPTMGALLDSLETMAWEHQDVVHPPDSDGSLGDA